MSYYSPVKKRSRTEGYNSHWLSQSSDSFEMNTDSMKIFTTDVAQFLSDPNVYRLTEEFINQTIVEESESVLTHCIKLQNVAAVEVLLQCGADPNLHNRKGVSPISSAAHKGNLAIMQLLIDHGAIVNAVNQSGSTALIQACHFGHVEAARLLLNHHANADFANVKGTTALMRASQEGHVDITQCLLQAGVEVNRRNHEGMNALMLASQRGHSDIVWLLIQAGAVMDEQTGQGSTALMLACKRGHERCAEVLVSMGAEIYMRDRRLRTARDTALRRSHNFLLIWLDTQLQVQKIQQQQHQNRAEMLRELRQAYHRGHLQLVEHEQFIADLTRAVGIVNGRYRPLDQSQVQQSARLVEDFRLSRVNVPFVAKNPETVLQEVEFTLMGGYRNIKAQTEHPLFKNFPARLAERVPDYAGWQWVQVLHKAFALPGGVFELIMEMLPLPRVWAWSIFRMRRRCNLAPQSVVFDLNLMMDEILRDEVLVTGADLSPRNSNVMVKINRSPHLHSALLEYFHMTPQVLDIICTWSDIQSLLDRSGETEIVFKIPIAQRMLQAAMALYRWSRLHSSSMRHLGLQANPAHGTTTDSTHTVLTNLLPSEINASASTYTTNRVGVMKVIPGVLTHDEIELLEDSIGLGTDMDFETGVHMEAETETEMQNGGEDGEMVEDSDNDAPAPAPQAAAVNIMPPHPPQQQHHNHHHHHQQGFHGHHF
jgi:ankyrin repeat protein